MVKLVRTLAPENGMHFEDICSFETMGHVGIWDHAAGAFVLLAKTEVEFHPALLPNCSNLDKLDDLVYAECEEHIISVSDRSTYKIVLTEE